MNEQVERDVIAVSTSRISDWHWRIVWAENALDIVLRDQSDNHVHGVNALYTRLGTSKDDPATDRDAVFAFPDTLRRNDADFRIGVDRIPVSWDKMEVNELPRGLAVILSSTRFDLRAELLFAIHPSGVLVKDTKVIHTGATAPLLLTSAPSFAFTLTDPVERAVLLSGEWGEETQVNRVSLQHVPINLESRAGKTGFEYNPWIALEADQTTIVAQLSWSGNWNMSARRGPGVTHLAGGIHEISLSHALHANQELVLPRATILRVAGDLNRATQCLHDYRRAERPNGQRNVPVQFNSWYPYPGEPNVADMMDFVPIAKKMQCEVFVLDAGWYTTDQEDPDESWWTRTGDWTVNNRLFPNGLEELSQACEQAGLQFGIWFEPEAISPSAYIRRNHPEWLHHVDGRAPSPNERAIVNLGIEGARQFALERILKILRATNAKWMKWDFNTDMRQGGWADGYTGAKDADPVVAHYQGLYRLQDEIRAAMPEPDARNVRRRWRSFRCCDHEARAHQLDVRSETVSTKSRHSLRQSGSPIRR
ncbi:alpha-galactosidase [Devosia algicola]|uniref:alpha-galactosidase n=1 Tax=Devosia algicola TaxID=3026418 RepID=A0ABY7YP40_9HYPH|nr:alpha-galactosidase [Devosia algicola]WDR03071.1 alpha-galactosidase [Devosia algicola]